jgi:hypothetical protein
MAWPFAISPRAVAHAAEPLQSFPGKQALRGGVGRGLRPIVELQASWQDGEARATTVAMTVADQSRTSRSIPTPRLVQRALLEETSSVQS